MHRFVCYIINTFYSTFQYQGNQCFAVCNNSVLDLWSCMYCLVYSWYRLTLTASYWPVALHTDFPPHIVWVHLTRIIAIIGASRRSGQFSSHGVYNCMQQHFMKYIVTKLPENIFPISVIIIFQYNSSSSHKSESVKTMNLLISIQVLMDKLNM